MQENEFEKQLKKMMDGFYVSPSSSVWEKVSRRLNEKRRRKTPLFFLLAAGLIVTGAITYFIYQQNYQNKNASLANKNISSTNNNKFKDSGNSLKQNSSLQNNITPSAGNSSVQLQYDKTLYSKESVSGNKKSDLVVREKISRGLNIIIHPQTNNKAVIQENDKQIAVKNNYNSNSNNLQAINSNETSLPTTSANNENDPIKAQSNHLTEFIKSSQNNSQTTSQNDLHSSVLKSQQTSKNKNYIIPKWQIGFTAFYGKSNLNGKLAEADNITASYLNFNPGMMRPSDTIPVNQHPFSGSKAYAFGITVQKRIFKNSFISSGLNFTHLAVKASIDKRINSAYVVQPSNTISNFYAVNNYYQAGQSATFTSKYNFIELPVNFQQYFFHSKQTSLSYNIGFSVRRLISSDELIYNSAGNIYFSKNDLLNKIQFQVNGGFNFAIKTSKSSSFFIGPQISYSLSNYLKNADNGNFHFVNYGVQAGFLLHKK